MSRRRACCAAGTSLATKAMRLKRDAVRRFAMTGSGLGALKQRRRGAAGGQNGTRGVRLYDLSIHCRGGGGRPRPGRAPIMRLRQHPSRHGLVVLVAGQDRPRRRSGDDHKDPRLACGSRARRGPADALLHHPGHTRAADRERRSGLPRLDRRGNTRGENVSRRAAIVLTALAASITAVAPAHAQSFPDHPIKVIVAYPPGGPTDTVARILTQGIAGQLGQSIIVENVAGAGGRIGTRDVARAAPDGYTLLLGGTNDNAIVVNPSVPVHTLAELASYTKANPGKLTSGATLGIAPHLLLEFIKVRTGADMVFVPYKGAAPAIADVLGNHIQVNASAKSVLLPLIKDGKLRALAVSSAQRWPELPDVPTLRESGLDGFPTAIWFVLMAPAATPPDVITKLNEAINLHILSADCREAIRGIGLEPHVLAPDVLAKVIADETQLWQGVARETGVHLE